MKKIIRFIKKETVLSVAWALAVLSAFWIKPSASYFEYIDWRSLGILWSLMAIMQGLKSNGVFEAIGWKLLHKTKKVWQLALVLIFLCFFTSMFITNDVALITFVPFTVMILINCQKEDIMIPIVVLQTIAANLGSMLTPIGNPQNLYLYGISDLSLKDFIYWMLPYSVVSGVLLLLGLVTIKGKSDSIVEEKHPKREPKENGKKAFRIISYLALFVFSLLVVARIFPYEYLVMVVIVVIGYFEYHVLFQVDYYLLLTFVGFFIFTGNMGHIEMVKNLLQELVGGKEMIVGILASQGISNVPAALLLSGFTNDYKSLLLGVNIGGLGTLIASMASLISYKFYVNQYPNKKGKYFIWFTVMNIIFLVILTTMAYLLN